jgi:hypothetical protein
MTLIDQIAFATTGLTLLVLLIVAVVAVLSVSPALLALSGH